MKKLTLILFVFISKLLLAQYDGLDNSFNINYIGNNKGFDYQPNHIFNYNDSLFLIIGGFNKYNDELSDGIILLDKNGEILKKYLNKEINLEVASHNLIFRKSEIIVTDLYIYISSYNGNILKFDHDGNLITTISCNIFVNAWPGMYKHNDLIYYFRGKLAKIIKNDVIVEEKFIELPDQNMGDIHALNFVDTDSSYIVFLRRDNPYDSSHIFKYDKNGKIDTSFNEINYFSESSLSYFLLNNKIYIAFDSIDLNGKYYSNIIAQYNIFGERNYSYTIEKVDGFVNEMQEDVNGNLLVGGYFFDNTSFKKISKYGIVDTLFLKNKIIGGYFGDFTILKNGNIILVGNFETYDSTYIGHIAKLNGAPKYDCNNLDLSIKKIRNITCTQKGMASFNISGGIEPLKYYINDSIVQAFDSLYFVDQGYYTIKVIDYEGCEQSITFLIKGKYGPQTNDLSIAFVSEPLNRGFEQKAWIDVQNTGCLLVDAKVIFTLPQEVNLISAFPAPMVVSNGTYQWHFDQLTGNQRINLTLKTTTFTTIGEIKNFAVKITPTEGDINPTNNAKEYSYKVVGSFDPNDMNNTPVFKCNANYATFDEVITYTIRFQNIGNFPATNIVVIDSLSPYIDLESINVVSTSHVMHVERERDQILKFVFNDILLPGKEIDEALSQGYVVFEAKIKNETPKNTIVKNKADIYFDFNEAVATNEVFNTVIDKIPVYQKSTLTELCAGDIIILNWFNLDVTIKADTSFQIKVIAADGCEDITELVFKYKPAINNALVLNSATLIAPQGYDKYQWFDCDKNIFIYSSTFNEYTPTVSGNYAVEILEDACRVFSECVFVEAANQTQDENLNDIKIYPNPTDAIFQIQSNATISKLLVFNSMGQKIVETGFISSIDLTYEPAGVYFVEITTDNRKYVKKVVKVMQR